MDELPAPIRPPAQTGSDTGLTLTEPGAIPQSVGTEGAGATIGHYKLLEKIGEGGFGEVYVAEQTEPVRRRVAFKVIKLGMDTRQVVARFEAERQALAMMDHPNIARVLDAGATQTGRPFFVMELVRGIKITEYCDQHQLTTRERLDLFIKVCQAIQHAHQKGVIHRDIKPSNILVALLDGAPVPKVIDFGIAKATEARLTDATVYTQLNQFLGTPAYMSPEQAEMSTLDIDTRSDIYSLGVLLYELLAGCTPFDPKELLAAGVEAMRRTIREKEPPRPSTRLATLKGEELTTTAKRRSSQPPRLIHALKGDLDWIVMKCLEKDRRRRYETANGLAMDLQRYIAGDAVVAAPPSTAYTLRKFVVRNRRTVAAVGALAAMLVAGGVVIVAVQAKANRQLAASNKRLTESYARESEARERERRRFDLAMEAIHTFHSEVSEDVLLKQKEFEGLRAKLLDQASQFYSRLQTEVKGDQDARSREALARASEGLGEVTGKVGSTDLALKDYEEARILYEQLVKGNPRDFGLKHRLALVLIELGSLHSDRHEAAPALQASDQALTLCEELTTQAPEAPEYQLALVRALQALANAHQSQPTEYERFAQRAVAAAEQLNNAHPKVPEYQRRLASTLIGAGNAAFGKGLFEDAMRNYDRAIEIYATVGTADAKDVKSRRDQAIALENKGMALERLGRWEAALAEHRRSLHAMQSLATDFPAVVEYQQVLASTYRGILGPLYEVGRVEEALAAARQRSAVLQRLAEEHPDRPDLERDAAVALADEAGLQAKLGRTDDSVATHRQVVERLQTLARRYPAVAEYQRSLSFTLQRLGVGLAQTGRTADATAAYRQARDVFESLVASGTATPQDRMNLADAYRALGSHLATTGQSKEGLRLLQQAEDLAQGVATEQSNTAEYRFQLGEILGYKASALRDSGDEAGSLETMERARVIRQQLADEYPKVLKYRGGLANTLSLIGLAHKRAGRLEEARKELANCKELWEQLVAEVPGEGWYGDNLGRALVNLGWLEETAGNLDAAVPLMQRSLTVREQAVTHDPKNTDYQRGLGYSLTYYGRVLRRLGKYDDSAAALTRGGEIAARLIAAKVEVSLVQVLYLENRVQLAMLDLARGDSGEAAKILRQAVATAADRQTPSVDELFDLAAAQAQLSRVSTGDVAQGHADRAQELLAAAVAKGFGDAAELRASDTVEPLRGRADFQKLLAALDAKGGPKRP